MSEIQRYYWTKCGMRSDCTRTSEEAGNVWVKHAALEAQAEELEEEFKALLQNEQRESDSRHECVVNTLNTKHAQELAEAKGEPEVKTLLSRVHRKIEIVSNVGCEHICVRCMETWPCETAVIAGLG